MVYYDGDAGNKFRHKVFLQAFKNEFFGFSFDRLFCGASRILESACQTLNDERGFLCCDLYDSGFYVASYTAVDSCQCAGPARDVFCLCSLFCEL